MEKWYAALPHWVSFFKLNHVLISKYIYIYVVFMYIHFSFYRLHVHVHANKQTMCARWITTTNPQAEKKIQVDIYLWYDIENKNKQQTKLWQILSCRFYVRTHSRNRIFYSNLTSLILIFFVWVLDSIYSIRFLLMIIRMVERWHCFEIVYWNFVQNSETVVNAWNTMYMFIELTSIYIYGLKMS